VGTALFPVERARAVDKYTVEVKLRRPARIGERIIVTARLVAESGKRMELAAEAKNDLGVLLAEGKATMVRV
ncbi:MAG: hypothetical protein ABIN58_10950, partial [candidate division WOR-3 bacterium]